MIWYKIASIALISVMITACKTKKQATQANFATLKDMTFAAASNELLTFDVEISEDSLPPSKTPTTDKDKRKNVVHRRIKGTMHRASVSRDTTKYKEVYNYEQKTEKPQKRKSMNTLYITLSLALMLIIFVYVDYMRK